MIPFSAEKLQHINQAIQLVLQASAEVLECIGSPEELSNQYKNYNAQNAKTYFIIKCLQEVQNAGFAMHRWQSFIELIASSDQRDLVPYHLKSILSEQSLWHRKLTEALVSLICFSPNNLNSYYYHYLLIQEIERNDYQAKTRKEYAGLESQIVKEQLKIFWNRLTEVENSPGFDTSRCWYLNNDSKKNTLVSNKNFSKLKSLKFISSVNSFLKRALKEAIPFEKSALMYSYEHAYSLPSQSMHFSPLPSFEGLIIENFYFFGFSKLSLLSAAIIARCQELGQFFPIHSTSISMQVFQSTKNHKTKNPFAMNAEVGDFVIVSHESELYLAEVISTVESSYGNASYEVHFLAERPIKTIEKDWMLAIQCPIFKKRSELQAEVLKPFTQEQILAEFSNQSELDQACRESICTVWKLANLKAQLKRTQPNTVPVL